MSSAIDWLLGESLVDGSFVWTPSFFITVTIPTRSHFLVDRKIFTHSHKVLLSCELFGFWLNYVACYEDVYGETRGRNEGPLSHPIVPSQLEVSLVDRKKFPARKGTVVDSHVNFSFFLSVKPQCLLGEPGGPH